MAALGDYPIARSSCFQFLRLEFWFAGARTIAVLLSLAVCLSTLAFARDARDVVVMKNGDRITCEVKGLQGGVLKVNLDYVDGTIAIDWLKIARVESSYLFRITLQDGSIYSAKVVSPETTGSAIAELSIQPQDGRAPILVDRSKVVSITQTSDSFLHRLSGGITLGSTYSKGNHAAQYSFGSELSYQRTRWGMGLRYNSNLSSNTGAETSTRNQVDFGANRMLSRKNYFLGGIATFLQSSVQGVHLQNSLGLGLGRYLKNTNRMRFWVLGGAGWQKTNYVPSVIDQPPQDIGVVLVSTELHAFVFKKTRLDITATAFPALTPQSGRLFYKTNASYYIKLFGKIDWNLSFYGNWDTRPPPQFPGSDYGSSTGLSWTFGNK